MNVPPNSTDWPPTSPSAPSSTIGERSEVGLVARCQRDVAKDSGCGDHGIDTKMAPSADGIEKACRFLGVIIVKGHDLVDDVAHGRDLTFLRTTVSDLSPLKGMPVTQLRVLQIEVSDLTPLRGMPLIDLHIRNTKITDLSPLEGMPLKVIHYDENKITNGLSTIRGVTVKP